ncbi:MAG: hypothetical protein CMD16_02065 [Flavobacteriales bacterium]|nr:hypothetical protein [Flavobacteriales bacterium]|tara:strand:+ start:91939 stop:92904 length:966 start_codon:yes stop_codon:yes gene_type:complete
MKKYLFTLLAGFIAVNSYAQAILSGDRAQGEKLIEAYFSPMAESFGGGLNNGWYNTAKPHSLGGFDFTLTVNTVFIPKSEKTFDIQDAGGQIFTSNTNNASTIIGSNDETDMAYSFIDNNGTQDTIDFKIPGGFDIPIVPLPIIQAGVGLIKNTAIDIRFIPKINIGKKEDDQSVKVNLFGVGLKHDLLQWIPGIGDAIPMSLSLQGGYTSLNAEMEIKGQNVSLSTKATTINLVASRKIVMITGYAGLGYNLSRTSFSTDTNFDLGGVEFEDKINVDFESNNDLRANLGLRLNMTIVTIHADYTFAKYPTATLGLGVSLR